MTNRQSALPILEELLRGQTTRVGFVSPLLSVTLAALSARTPRAPVVRLGKNAVGYAKTIGLDVALEGKTPALRSVSGKTYSALARIDAAAHVESASGLIDDFVYERLDRYPSLAAHIARVVGELHDNVASHSHGVGFSAAQTYGQRFELAIADNGCGMRRRVTSKVPTINSDTDAIKWCLVKGNTTGAIDDDWAQRLPEDALDNPYPPGVTTRRNANNHLGEGLWQLSELVQTTGGTLFVWSGEGAIVTDKSGTHSVDVPCWTGVVIELALPVVSGGSSASDVTESGLEELAARLGI